MDGLCQFTGGEKGWSTDTLDHLCPLQFSDQRYNNAQLQFNQSTGHHDNEFIQNVSTGPAADSSDGRCGSLCNPCHTSSMLHFITSTICKVRRAGVVFHVPREETETPDSLNSSVHAGPRGAFGAYGARPFLLGHAAHAFCFLISGFLGPVMGSVVSSPNHMLNL